MLLAAIAWNADSDGLWDVATNWNPQQVPAGGDDVTIDRGAANPTITIRDVGQDYSVNMLTSRESLVISARTLTVNAASQIDASTLTLSGGNLTANGTVTITATGELDWQAGTISGNGLANSGTTTISSDTTKQLNGILNNAGMMVLKDAGTLGIADCCGFAVNIQSGGTFDIQSDADTNLGIINVQAGGTLMKSGAVGGMEVSRLASRVNVLGGSIDVEAGKLTLAGNGVSTGGTFDVLPGPAFDLTRGTSVVSYGVTYTGSGGGQVLLYGGRLDTPGTGATFDFPANMLEWTGGAIFGSGTGFINAVRS